MLEPVPKISKTEIRQILADFAGEGIRIPEPSKVEVIPDEDFEGDPVYRLKIVFPQSIEADATPWNLVSPLVMRLTRMVLERTGYERPVVDKVIRLAAEPAAGK